MCCSPWGHRESDTTEQLNNVTINFHLLHLTSFSTCCLLSEITYTWTIKQIPAASLVLHLEVRQQCDYLLRTAREQVVSHLSARSKLTSAEETRDQPSDAAAEETLVVTRNQPGINHFSTEAFSVPGSHVSLNFHV